MGLRAARDIAEIFLDERARGGGVDIAREHEDGVVGAIMLAEPVLHILKAGGVEIRHRADRRMAIRMIGREERGQLGIFDQTIRLVVALTLFVLDDAALVIELVLRHRAEQMAHAIGFEEERAFERAGWHGFEIIGAIEPGGAVEIGGAHLLQRFEEIAGGVFRPVEHQMFEEMREPGLALGFVLGADIVPDRDRHDGRLAIGMDDHAQPVGQRELLMRDLHLVHQRGDGNRGCGLGLGLGSKWNGDQGKKRRGAEPGDNRAHRNILFRNRSRP